MAAVLILWPFVAGLLLWRWHIRRRRHPDGSPGVWSARQADCWRAPSPLHVLRAVASPRRQPCVGNLLAANRHL